MTGYSGALSLPIFVDISELKILAISIFFTAVLFGLLKLKNVEVLCFSLWKPDGIVSVIYNVHAATLSVLVMYISAIFTLNTKYSMTSKCQTELSTCGLDQ